MFFSTLSELVEIGSRSWNFLLVKGHTRRTIMLFFVIGFWDLRKLFPIYFLAMDKGGSTSINCVIFLL